MPWKQTDPMTERVKMITDHLSGNYSPTELSRRYGISRESVYKWLGRYEEFGWAGLEDLSRAPHVQAKALSGELEAQILELRRRWADWGAPKLRHKLQQRVGAERCPGESTVSAVLK